MGGLMDYTPDGTRFQLTALGKKNYAGVISQFYAPSVQNHLISLEGGEDFPTDPLTAVQMQVPTMMNEYPDLVSNGVHINGANGKSVNGSEPGSETEKREFEFGNILFGGKCN